MLVNANDLFKGTVLIAIPHSDDEALGCGEAIAGVTEKSRLHFVYVSDSSGSPAPRMGQNPNASLLARIRQDEALAALASLGVPRENATFLGLKDGTLSSRQSEIEQRLFSLCEQLRPQTIVAPFRYDSHPDHLAVNRAAMALLHGRRVSALLLEYFVYFQLRLLPKQDIRAYLDPLLLRHVHSAETATAKRAALSCYTSQCTVMFPWQKRPVFDSHALDAIARTPEYYLQSNVLLADAEIFRSSRFFVKLVHAIEPRLKKINDRLTSVLRV